MSDSPKDISDVTPSSLSHVVGQRSVVNQVSIALDAAFADNKALDHCLLVGPPGLGKTQIAKVIAAELATDLHEVLGQSVQCSADLNAVLLAAKDKDVVFIDEVHELDKQHQTALYLALDQRRVFLSTKRGSNAPKSIPVAKFSLLLASTDEYCLLQPLRDRMKLTLRFQFYSEEDLALLLNQRSQALEWNVHESLFPAIAQRSRGTPRLALRLLQSCRRVCRAEGENALFPDHLEKACSLEGIDCLGLGPTEQQYLRILSQGTSRLNVVASRLGLPARTVSEVTEPFLIRMGLVEKDHQGRRQLTAQGREHLCQIQE